jgi:hypothetical protein
MGVIANRVVSRCHFASFTTSSYTVLPCANVVARPLDTQLLGDLQTAGGASPHTAAERELRNPKVGRRHPGCPNGLPRSSQHRTQLEDV